MKLLNYLDIPVLRSYGFEAGSSGYTWWARDKDGGEWSASIDEDLPGTIVFKTPDGTNIRMGRERLDKHFEMNKK